MSSINIEDHQCVSIQAEVAKAVEAKDTAERNNSVLQNEIDHLKGALSELNDKLAEAQQEKAAFENNASMVSQSLANLQQQLELVNMEKALLDEQLDAYKVSGNHITTPVA